MGNAVMCDQCGKAVAALEAPDTWYFLSVPELPVGDAALGKALLDALAKDSGKARRNKYIVRDLCSTECVRQMAANLPELEG